MSSKAMAAATKPRQQRQQRRQQQQQQSAAAATRVARNCQRLRPRRTIALDCWLSRRSGPSIYRQPFAHRPCAVPGAFSLSITGFGPCSVFAGLRGSFSAFHGLPQVTTAGRPSRLRRWLLQQRQRRPLRQGLVRARALAAAAATASAAATGVAAGRHVSALASALPWKLIASPA